MKESYERTDLLLEKIQYEKYNWNICGDARVLLLGVRLDHRKFCCFLCEWDSRGGKYHYVQKQWHQRESLIAGQKNEVNIPLINPEQIYLPALHIKLWLFQPAF